MVDSRERPAPNSNKRYAVMKMKSIATAAVLALSISQVALSQYSPTVNVKWTAVTTQEDGTVIDSSDVSYIVYNEETSTEVCTTQDVKCTFEIVWGECVTLHAKAQQMSTALLSIPSNSVRVCSGDRPNFRLSPPVIEVSLGDIGGQ